jgi:hypothetical protein
MEVDARIEGLQRIAIHGSPYVRVYYSLPGDDETILNCQIPAEAMDDDIRVGDSVKLTMLLRTVMEVRKART